jgi:hypothetical protein
VWHTAAVAVDPDAGLPPHLQHSPLKSESSTVADLMQGGSGETAAAAGHPGSPMNAPGHHRNNSTSSAFSEVCCAALCCSVPAVCPAVNVCLAAQHAVLLGGLVVLWLVSLLSPAHWCTCHRPAAPAPPSCPAPAVQTVLVPRLTEPSCTSNLQASVFHDGVGGSLYTWGGVNESVAFGNSEKRDSNKGCLGHGEPDLYRGQLLPVRVGGALETRQGVWPRWRWGA